MTETAKVGVGDRTEAGTGPARRLLARLDPELVAAAREVDRSLLRWMLDLTPRERLAASSRGAEALERFRRGSSATG